MAFLPFLFAGCGDNSTTPVSDVNQEPATQNVPDEIQRVVDTYSLPDSVIWQEHYLPANTAPPSMSDTAYDVYAITFIWGQLCNSTGSAAGNITDWSGSMYVNAVAVVAPVLTIDFEPGQDSLVPQNNSASVGWVSITDRDFDGIGCLIFLKRGIEYFAAPWLTFETEPFKIELEISQLEKLTAYYKVDSTNAVVVHARRVWPHHCPWGIMLGEWIKIDMSGDSGYFRGEWLDRNSELTGVFSGIFYISAEGERVMHGWLSHYMLDVVIAEMWGMWCYDDLRECALCGSGFGKFGGVFKYTTQEGWGRFEGEIAEYSITSKQMSLKGIWRQYCAPPGSTINNL